jgi:hypothetical protein
VGFRHPAHQAIESRNGTIPGGQRIRGPNEVVVLTDGARDLAGVANDLPYDNDGFSYLNSNVESLIDYRTWQRVGGRIATGFVESSINRIVGRRMCKSQHMRWSRVGAHSVVQVRVALLNQEFDELARDNFCELDNDVLRGPGRKHSRVFNGFPQQRWRGQQPDG